MTTITIDETLELPHTFATLDDFLTYLVTQGLAPSVQVSPFSFDDDFFLYQNHQEKMKDRGSFIEITHDAD